MEARLHALTRSSGWLSGATAAAFSAVLTMVLYRPGRLLTFDGFHYCELAKQFTTNWPDRFGNHWPFGYPLAGGLLGRLGLAAYPALVLVSVAALLVWLAAAAVMVGPHPRRAWVLIGLGSAPVVGVQLGGVLTELPLAAALLLMAVSFAYWPRRSAIWLSAGAVLLAFAVRYAGLIALAAFFTWAAVEWRALGDARRRLTALAAAALALVAVASALILNLVRSGHASGAGRGPMPGLGALPTLLADFGWSPPSALIAGGVRNLIEPGSPAQIAIGLVLTTSLILLGGWSWWRPGSRFSRPLALVGVGYLAGMVVLRCIGEFDALYNARTFLPALAPFVLLGIERLARLPSVIAIASLCLIASGATAAARGISREIGADVRPVVEPIRTRIRSTDTIAINDHAFSLSAYFAQATVRVSAGHPAAMKSHRFLVVGGRPANRAGEGAVCPREWREECRRLVAAGAYRYLVDLPAIVALERIESPPTASAATPADRQPAFSPDAQRSPEMGVGEPTSMAGRGC